MTQWATFTVLVAVLCGLLLVLTWLTQRALTPAVEVDGESGERPSTGNRDDPTADAVDTPDSAVDREHAGERSVDVSTDCSDRSPPLEEHRPADEAVESVPDEAVEPVTDEGDPTAASRERPSAPDASQSRDGTGQREGEIVRTSDTLGDGSPALDRRGRARRPRDSVAAYVAGEPVTTRALLVNVAVTQAVFAALLVGVILYTGVPAEALGVDLATTTAGPAVAVGVGAGLALYAANEGAARLAKRVGIEHSEALRGMLAPETAAGWVGLLVVVLPLIAVFEELLFRAVLIGALSAGFDLSPWLLAVGSSILFALGHGIQGTAGILVTGLLGFVLAALFVLTGSLLVVIVAHYVINACEFVVHEGFEVEWTAALAD